MWTSILVLAGVWIVGHACAFLVVRRAGSSDFLLAAGLAPGLALGLLSLQAFFARVVFGAPLHWFVPAALFAGLAAVVRNRSNPSEPLDRRPSQRRVFGLRGLFHALAAVLAIQCATVFFLASRAKPHGGYDAVAIWNVRARTLNRVGPGRLEEVLSGLVHGDYPLLLPEGLAYLFRIRGLEEPLLQQGLAFAFLVGLCALAYSAVRRMSGGLAAACALVLLLASPQLVLSAASQYADVPLSYFFLAAALCSASLLARDRALRVPPMLAGFFVGVLPWTKNEGSVMAIVLVTALAAFLSRPEHEGRRRGVLLGMLAGATPPLAALLVFKLILAPENDLVRETSLASLASALDTERWRTVGAAFWHNVGLRRGPSPYGGAWGFVWPATAVVAITFTGFRRRAHLPETGYLGVVAVTMLCAWFAVYLVTPKPLEWHLSTSLNRLLVQILPLFVVSACCLVDLEVLAENGANEIGIESASSETRNAREDYST